VIRPVFHHVNIRTTRLQEMIDWYGVVVGTEVTHRFEFGAWITNDAANHRIALLAFPQFEDDPHKDTRTGLDHTAFEHADFGQLMDTYERLRARRIVPIMCLDHGMTTSLYYTDPDGNRLELQVDNFGDWRASTEFMRDSSEFASDPLGPFFDPDAVLAAWRAGVTVEEIRAGTRVGRYAPDRLPDVPRPQTS
jgi:catechol-2,3-dioxygenase